jgi:tRNA pseudouridine38-40 synthase
VARYFIQFAYKGTRYQGWQIQPHTSDTVQQVMNEKLSLLARETIGVTGCGRTDSGVHATCYYAHFDAESNLTEDDDFIYNLNKVLPVDIAVQRIVAMPDSAHARYDATYREYAYHIVKTKNAFAENLAWYYSRSLNMLEMNRAAQLFLKQTDFAAFCKAGSDVKGTACNVTKAEWAASADRLVFTIGANRFLRNMVRAAVGTLLDVGSGKTTVDEVQRILNSGDRSEAGQSVPAHGLYLTDVHYPEQYKLNNQLSYASDKQMFHQFPVA